MDSFRYHIRPNNRKAISARPLAEILEDVPSSRRRTLKADDGPVITTAEHNKNFLPRIARQELPISGIVRMLCGGGYRIVRKRKKD